MRWRCEVVLTCGCARRYLQDGGTLPDPGEVMECTEHGNVEVRRASRVSR